ncbi:hypothetical protein [Szabonella alba]|uniref:Uncharacterized protein n=1 Tax=Szabonella alba TaxID=2804194 RepID=A0A8K0VFR7_9RHOB|nr:hypothetical protein [Szabonella alba]MBL4918965.1 hypothetical protein [Szabonella alba]
MAFDAGATASLWGLEGPLVHAIRSDLCLQGWGWVGADAMARDVLADVFRKVNAVRPTWREGQPDWTIPTNILIERTRCARCHGPLPEGRPKFCSDLCKASHSSSQHSARETKERVATAMAVQLI